MAFLNKIIYKTPFAVFIYLLSIFFIHPFFEEGATASRVSTLKGLFFPAITDWPLNQLFISDFFAFLYQNYNSIPWYGMVELSLILIVLVFSYKVLARYKNPLLLLVFYVISLDDILLMSFTRTASLLLTLGPALLFLEVNKAWRKCNASQLAYVTTLFILIIIGFLNKPYAASFSLTLNGIFFFAYIALQSNKGVKILKTVAFILTPIFFIFALIFSIYLKQSSSDHIKAISYSPKFYNLNSADSYVQNLSSKDAVGILLLENNFISDRSYYNDDFIERVTKNKNKQLIDFSKFFDNSYYHKFKTKYIPLLLKNHSLEWTVLGLFLVLILFGNRSFLKFKLPIGLFILGGIAIILALSILVKIELRVSSPILLYVYFCAVVLFSVPKNRFKINKVLQIALLVLASFILLQKGKSIKLKSKNAELQAAINQSILNSFNENFSEENTLIFNLPSYAIIKGMPLKDLENQGNYSVQTYDAEAMTYMKSFKKMLNEYSGSIAMTDFYKKIHENKETTYIISSDKWNQLLMSYMKEVHGKVLYFKKIGNHPVTKELQKKDLNIYELQTYR